MKKGHIFIENKPLIEIGEQLSQISGYPANIPKAPPKRSINRFLAPQTLKNGTYGIFGRNFPEHFWALSGPKGLLGVWGPYMGPLSPKDTVADWLFGDYFDFLPGRETQGTTSCGATLGQTWVST